MLRSVGPAVLVGHSLGGVAAWWAARLVPELVLGAFLEDPPLYMGEPAEHRLNTGIPHFRHLRSSVPAWQAEGISEQTAVERLAAEPFAPNPSLTVGEVVTEEALAARAYALLHLDPTVLDTVIDGTLLAATDTVSPVTRAGARARRRRRTGRGVPDAPRGAAGGFAPRGRGRAARGRGAQHPRRARAPR